MFSFRIVQSHAIHNSARHSLTYLENTTENRQNLKAYCAQSS